MVIIFCVGLTRESADAQLEFVEADGFSVLLRAMMSPVEKLQIKSTFLMSALCQQQPQFKGLCPLHVTSFCYCRYVLCVRRWRNLLHFLP